jgi:hypothetical protein
VNLHHFDGQIFIRLQSGAGSMKPIKCLYSLEILSTPQQPITSIITEEANYPDPKTTIINGAQIVTH